MIYFDGRYGIPTNETKKNDNLPKIEKINISGNFDEEVKNINFNAQSDINNIAFVQLFFSKSKEEINKFMDNSNSNYLLPLLNGIKFLESYYDELNKKGENI